MRQIGDLNLWIETSVLPFWAGKASHESSWPESLSPQGEPDWSKSRRLRVAARQVFAYAQAADLGWAGPFVTSKGERTAYQIAKCTCDWWWQNSWAVDGLPGLAHRLGTDGQILDSKRDAYDHAFGILALTWIIRTSAQLADRLQAIERLEHITDFMRNHMQHPDGLGYVECLEIKNGQFVPDLNIRRQNPHMHLLEAMLSACIALPEDERFPKYARELLSLFENHIYEPKTGFVREDLSKTVAQNANPTDTLLGEMPIEPGHMAEWIWLLEESHKVLGVEHISGQAIKKVQAHLYKRSLELGWPGHEPDTHEPDTTALIDWFNPTSAEVATTARSWPTMELGRAALIQGDRVQAQRCVTVLLDQFATPEGGWRDAVALESADAETQAALQADPKTHSMQTSTMYHLLTLAACISQS